jgi:hypothetical protein
MTGLVLPIGLLVGTFHDAAPARHHHEIRLGAKVHECTDHELAAWAFAHGPPEGFEDGPADGGPSPWMAASLVRHLAGLDIPDAASIVAGLLGRGLLAELVPGTESATAFARAHRLVPSMYGLGNSADGPGLYSIGLLGHEVIRVDRPVFELWAWADTEPDLWRACESFAAEEVAAGGSEPAVTEPDRVLAGFLGTLHGLLSVQAAHLDTVELDRTRTNGGRRG